MIWLMSKCLSGKNAQRHVLFSHSLCTPVFTRNLNFLAPLGLSAAPSLGAEETSTVPLWCSGRRLRALAWSTDPGSPASRMRARPRSWLVPVHLCSQCPQELLQIIYPFQILWSWNALPLSRDPVCVSTFWGHTVVPFILAMASHFGENWGLWVWAPLVSGSLSLHSPTSTHGLLPATENEACFLLIKGEQPQAPDPILPGWV